MTSRTVYPLSTVRALALHAQGLDIPNGSEPEPTLENILSLLQRIRAVQLDTLQIVQRSQNLVLWSRLGTYDPANFERLIYDQDHRRLYEGWLHAACILLLDDYRFELPRKRKVQQENHPWFQDWISQPGHAEIMHEVLERVRRNGPVRAQDFEHTSPRRGSWWDWKPAKIALEHHFSSGSLMISKRTNFQRVYDLAERVLPTWVDTTEPSWEEVERHWIEIGASSLGICRPDQAATYGYRNLLPARKAVKELLASGSLVKVQAFLLDDKPYEMLVHRDQLPLLEQAADGALPSRRTTFLSFFDNIFWARGRDEQVWGYRNVLEAYKPEAQRVWGYFCLPILHHDRLVGRFDPKLERSNATLRLKAIYLEPGVSPDEQLLSDLAVAMRDFLAFHQAHNLVIERSQPAGLGEHLMKLL